MKWGRLLLAMLAPGGCASIVSFGDYEAPSAPADAEAHDGADDAGALDASSEPAPPDASRLDASAPAFACPDASNVIACSDFSTPFGSCTGDAKNSNGVLIASTTGGVSVCTFTLPAPRAVGHLVLSLDFALDRSDPTSEAELTQVLLDRPDGSSGPTSTFALDRSQYAFFQSDTEHLLKLAMPELGVWNHFTMDLDYGPGAAIVTINGKSDTFKFIPDAKVLTAIQVGISYVYRGRGDFSFRFDNLLVTSN